MRVVREATVDKDTLVDVLRPRHAQVVEREAGPGRFTAETGPYTGYLRTVEVLGSDGDDSLIRQTVDFEVAIPFWGWLFVLPTRIELGRVRPRERPAWWSAPEALDARATAMLASLTLLALAAGYVGVLLSQTLTFAAEQFHADTGAQGVVLGVARGDVVLALFLVALADRRGRRWVLLTSGVGAALFTFLGAFAPSLAILTATQVGARGCQSAMAIVLTIMAAEEMPAGSRAYAISILTLTGALGAGIPILLLFVADLHPGGWRVLFALAILLVPMIRRIGRGLPESRRFGQPHVAVPLAGHSRRFWILAVSGFLFALFFTPAVQFTNEFLRAERGFSAGRISLFTILTNVPGGLGIVVGGRLAERGRRAVGAVATIGGVGMTVLMFLSTGWPLWAWSGVGSVLGAAAVPALGVYGPELFPTSLRGRANGIITALSRAGSVIGLVAVGFLSRSLGGLGPALAALAVGPAIVAVLIVVAYPETAHLELEDINPEDRAPPTSLR